MGIMTDRIYKQFLMQEAAKRLREISECIAAIIAEMDKEVTIKQYDPQCLRERIGAN
jgi:hypothetical protein